MKSLEHRIGRLVLIAALAFSVSCKAAPEQPEQPKEAATQSIVFRAVKGELWSTGQLSEGKADNEFVEVVLSGKYHDPPIVAEEVDRDTASWDTPTDTVISEFYAMKNYDKQWILSNHTDEDRFEIANLISDGTAEQENQAFFAQIDKLYIISEITYGPRYALVIYALGVPSKRLVGHYEKTDAGWKITEKLANDETAAVVEAALRVGEIKPLPSGS